MKVQREDRCLECQRFFRQPIRPSPRVTCSEKCRAERRRRQGRIAQRRFKTKEVRELSTDIALALREPRTGRRLGMRLEDLIEVQHQMSQRRRGDETPKRLAVRYGVTTRSIYRYADYGPPVVVRVGHYRAWFAARKVGPPVMLTEWIG